MLTTEHLRLNNARQSEFPWKKWGPYLSERQWGTVREDYSENGDAWNFLHMIRPVRAPTAGARTASLVFPMITSVSASPWPCGIAKIQFSRSGCSD